MERALKCGYSKEEGLTSVPDLCVCSGTILPVSASFLFFYHSISKEVLIKSGVVLSHLNGELICRD